MSEKAKTNKLDIAEKTLSATEEQLEVLNNNAKSLIVSASAGSGKTWVLVEYITKLICEKKIPVKRLLVLTFTNAGAGEMKERLLKSIMSQKPNKFLLEQIDDIPVADICTIDAFCEKVIKRNIEKLELDESFIVLDDGGALKLRLNAFSNSIKEFEEKNQEDYQYIYSSFKKNKDYLFKCLRFIEDFLDASDNPQEIIENILNKQECFFDHACQYLLTDFLTNFNELENQVRKLNLQNSNDKYITFGAAIVEILNKLHVENLFELASLANVITLPTMPRLSEMEADTNVKNALADIKNQLKDLLDQLKSYNFENKTLLQHMKQGKLAVGLVKLYQEYKTAYTQAKLCEDCLDFGDMERYCQELLNNQDVALTLQESYDYVFIDEYQDTNRLQEKILKNIASKGNFVAVGDPKQAIYGFRNATMQIMKSDIETNNASNSGNVVFLRGNFRSDKRVLDFVNSVFKVLMKESNVGIDYSSTSMLDGLAPYIYDKDKAVEVCFVKPKENEIQEKNQVYSVKNDLLQEKNKDLLEINTIIAFIDDMLTKQIYDIKEQRWRAVEFNDIVVLMRSRGDLMQGLESQLKLKGYAVVADNKECLTEDGEIEMLINFLNFCLDKNNQVAFVSILLSKLGGMEVQEISEITSLYDKDTFENLINSDNAKVNALLEKIQTFKSEYEIYGIRHAFERLFDKCDYFAYLSYLGESKKQAVEKFLNIISQSGFNYSIASLIAYLNSLSAGKLENADAVSNAITLMTIHGSKGLEFPIVILAGCGKNLNSGNKTSYEINEKYGLSTMEFDIDLLAKTRTPQLEMARRLKKLREYIDELMIFYVALTRAKNKLVLTGTFDFEKQKLAQTTDFFKGKTYFDWLIMSLSEADKNNLLNNEEYENEFAHFVKVNEVQNLKAIEKENLIIEEDKDLTEKIIKYLDFVYPNLNLAKVEFKNSVTGLLKINLDENEVETEESNLSDLFMDKPQPTGQFTFAEIGTLYHDILKLTDFSKISSMQDLLEQISILQTGGFITKEQIDILDLDILFKDIIILKNLTKNMKIFKEKPFIMKIPLNEIFNCQLKNYILVQGVVDMFCLGEQNILVDYKFTSIKNQEKILEKYSKQLILYSKAIEKAFNIKLNKKYIFSLKNSQLIEFFE